MGRGGKRVGAGRPKVDSVDRSEVILDELLLPAFKVSLTDGVVFVSEEHIRLAYGRQGVREWMTWYDQDQVGHGIAGRDGVTTSWKLKLKLVVAARKLLTGVDQSKLIFPSDAIRLVMNKKAYTRWASEFVRIMTEMSVEYNHRIIPPPPFNPARDYLKHEHHIRDGTPRAPITDLTKGYLEMVTGGVNGFVAPYDGIIPDDVPY